MNLLCFEIRRRIPSLMWWMLGLSSLQIMMLSLFPVMASEYEIMDMILRYYPPELLAAFGLSSAVSLGDIHGVLIFSFIFAQVALAIHASIEGFSILTYEESENFADFLLTKPRSRKAIFITKSLAMLIIMSILSIITALSTVVAMVWFAPQVPISQPIIILLLTLLPLQLLFYVSAMSISQFLPTVKTPVSLAMGLSFGMYMMYALRGALDFDLLRYLNFYNYVDITLILNQKPIPWVFVIISVVVVVGGIIGSQIAYDHRNIVSK